MEKPLTSQDLSFSSEKGGVGLGDHFVKFSMMDLALAIGRRESHVLTPTL